MNNYYNKIEPNKALFCCNKKLQSTIVIIKVITKIIKSPNSKKCHKIFNINKDKINIY